MKPRFEADRERKRIIRKAAWYAVFFGFAGVIVAIAGSALIAFLLSFSGLPFVRTWLAVSALVIAAGAALVVWQNRRKTQ